MALELKSSMKSKAGDGHATIITSLHHFYYGVIYMHHVIIVACPFPTFDFKQVNDCDKEHACPSILYLAMIQTLTQ